MTQDYRDALRALKLDHDRDLKALLKDRAEGTITPESYIPRQQGIANRYKNAARRLAIEHGIKEA